MKLRVTVEVGGCCEGCRFLTPFTTCRLFLNRQGRSQKLRKRDGWLVRPARCVEAEKAAEVKP